MKQIFFLLLILNVFNTINAQCTVDAGADVVLCLNKSGEASNNLHLNAKVLTASKPKSIRWVMDYRIVGNTFIHAKDFVDDTSILNPKFLKGNKFAKNYMFYIYIVDSLNNSCKDSINVRVSSFAILTDLQDKVIKLGDTVNIYSIVGNGIPPLKSTWTPVYNISSSNNRSPFVWPSKYTKYTCITTDSAGCVSDWGDYWNIYIDSSSSIQSFSILKDFFSNFHNPIFQNSVFELNKGNNLSGIEIYNSIGQKIYSHNDLNKLEIGKIAKEVGLYHLVLFDRYNKMHSIKIQRE